MAHKAKILRLGSALVVSVAATAVLVPTGAQAAGFFEQLFGGAAPAQEYAPPPPPPAYDYAAPPQRAAVPHPRRKAAIEVRDNKQTPTDLMHDKTLQVGDAVMMKNGIHVYEGPESSHHDADEFVSLDRASDISRKERSLLVAADTTRNDPLRGAINPDTISSGRSASVSVPISDGYRITDAKGRSVRYVGP